MKKLIIIFFVLFSVSLNAQIKWMPYGEYYKENFLGFDITNGLGKRLVSEGGSTNVLSAELTIYGFMLGTLWEFDDTYYANKTVSVSSYTKTVNGKTVHVNGYKRSAPNAAHHSMKCSTIYAGFWLPCGTVHDCTLYVSPLAGFSEYEFVYGAAIKLSIFKGFGLSFNATNKSYQIGFNMTWAAIIALI